MRGRSSCGVGTEERDLELDLAVESLDQGRALGIDLRPVNATDLRKIGRRFGHRLRDRAGELAPCRW